MRLAEAPCRVMSSCILSFFEGQKIVMRKHAFLLIAHEHFQILELLLTQLDHERNDIYLHIDRKCGRIDEERFRRCCRKSRLVFIPRRRVYWGHSSLVACELDLLQAAVDSGEDYAYYHLLSGTDLQIRSTEEIHRFFDNRPPRQFLAPRDLESGLRGMDRYYFFLPLRAYSRVLARGLDTVSRLLQKLFRVHRLKKWQGIRMMKTQQWFSITAEFAEYVLQQRDFIRSFTRFTSCSDEMFLGTVLANSPFFRQLSRHSALYGHLRLIDRERAEKASPHTWTIDDWDMIEQAQNCFWARKFNEERDPDVIRKVVETWPG